MVLQRAGVDAEGHVFGPRPAIAVREDPADEVLEFLTDKPTVAEVLTSCFEISQASTPDLPVPDTGFAASPAFDAAGPLTVRLRAEHDAAMEGLYYGTDEPPTFDKILERVHAHSALLAVS